MKTEEIKIGMQVQQKRQLQSHGNMSEIRIGTLTAQREGPHGTLVKVSFPMARTVVEVPVESVEPVSRVLGRARVQFNPANRGVAFLR